MFNDKTFIFLNIKVQFNKQRFFVIACLQLPSTESGVPSGEGGESVDKSLSGEKSQGFNGISSPDDPTRLLNNFFIGGQVEYWQKHYGHLLLTGIGKETWGTMNHLKQCNDALNSSQNTSHCLGAFKSITAWQQWFFFCHSLQDPAKRSQSRTSKRPFSHSIAD